MLVPTPHRHKCRSNWWQCDDPHQLLLGSELDRVKSRQRRRWWVQQGFLISLQHCMASPLKKEKPEWHGREIEKPLKQEEGAGVAGFLRATKKGLTGCTWPLAVCWTTLKF